MDIGIIITGHGRLASGIMSTVEMVFGKTDRAHAIDFNLSDNYEDLDEKYIDAYNSLDSCDEILVLCDLLGGTPFNRAYSVLNEKGNVHFIVGVNFYMAYLALTHSDDNIDSFIKTLLDKTKEHIVEYK